VTAAVPAPVAVAATSGPQHVLWYPNDVHRVMFGDRPLGLSVRETFPDVRQQQYIDVLDEVLRSGRADPHQSPATLPSPEPSSSGGNRPPPRTRTAGKHASARSPAPPPPAAPRASPAV
jgi:hypothetical protein